MLDEDNFYTTKKNDDDWGLLPHFGIVLVVLVILYFIFM